ncbi:MAG: peptidylprolyl isomerase [Candidatus Omnitrophota bacterium]
MRQNPIPILIVCGLLIFSITGCEKFSELKIISKKQQPLVVGTVIAKVNDMAITQEQLDEEIGNYNQLMEAPEARLSTKEQKLAYLNEELVRRYLFYQEAKKRGMDKQDETQKLLRNLEINILANQFLQKEMENILVTSSEIEDFYNLYKEQYRQQEERSIKEIVVDAQSEAKEILIELLKGAEFAELAKRYSKAESASRGGNLGFIAKGQRGVGFARFDEVAFSPSLDVGQVSNIFKDTQGYYIIKVEEIKGGQSRALSDVWDEIKRNVLFLKQQQKLQELANRLLSDADLVIYDEKVR